jgi:hypothetical protein
MEEPLVIPINECGYFVIFIVCYFVHVRRDMFDIIYKCENK